jgi:hypothetical protein
MKRSKFTDEQILARLTLMQKGFREIAKGMS